MTTRLEATVDINLASARVELTRLQADLDQLARPVDIPVTLSGEQQIRELERDIDRASGVIDVDVDSSELTAGERAIREINDELREAQTELQQAQGRADALGDELQRTGRIGSGAFSSLRQAIIPLAATFAAGLGIREVVQQFNAAVTAASDLEQSIGGVQAIFGSSADQILRFGETAADAVGLSANAANQLSSQIGAQLQSYGFAVEESAVKTQELITLGADLAATFGGPVSQSVEAIGSLLRGETNPIERYGVSMNVAAIEAHALETGIIGVGEQLTIQTKAVAALDLLYRQTGGAQGQFARESETTAGQLERLRAEFANVQAEIGEALIPAFEALLDTGPQIIEAFRNAAPAFGELALAALELADPLADVVGFLGDLASAAAGDLDDIFVELARAMGFTAEQAERLANAQGFEGVQGIDTRAAEEALEQFEEFRGILSELERSIEAGLVQPMDSARAAFASVNQVIPLTAEGLRAIVDTSGLAGDDLIQFLREIVVNAEGLGLTAAEIRVVRDAFNELFETTRRAPGGGASPIDDVVSALERFREAEINAFSQPVADSALRERFSDLPVVVSDLDSLKDAAENAGSSVGDFLDNLPDDITINVEPAVLSLVGLIETLGEVETALSTASSAPEVELPELKFDDEGTVTNIDEVVQAILDDATVDAEFDATLAKLAIDADAIDVAALVASLGPEVGSALGEAFLLDSEQLETAQSALDGSMVTLAEGGATSLAETLRDATPAEVIALGVFAADNFVSDAMKQQLGETAGVLAEAMETALDGTTLSPEFIISLTNAQITGLPTFTQPVSTGGGGGGSTGGGSAGGPPGAQFQININNPTTQDLGTSSSQAAETIGAVGNLLAGVR